MSNTDNVLCRKVSVRKKRSGEVKTKTPKKCKVESFCENSFEKRLLHDTSKCNDPWIQNSFVDGSCPQSTKNNTEQMYNQTNDMLSSSNFASRSRSKHLKCSNNNNKNDVVFNYENNGIVNNEKPNNVSQHKATVVNHNTFPGDQGKNNCFYVEQPTSGSSSCPTNCFKHTSTPNKKQKHNKGKVLKPIARVSPTTFQEPEQYSSQHQSFNDSDSLFAELDLPDGEPSMAAVTKSAIDKAECKFSKSSNHRISKPKCSLREKVIRDNTIGKMSMDVGFDSDDALLVDIDLQTYEKGVTYKSTGNSGTNESETVLIETADMVEDALLLCAIDSCDMDQHNCDETLQVKNTSKTDNYKVKCDIKHDRDIKAKSKHDAICNNGNYVQSKDIVKTDCNFDNRVNTDKIPMTPNNNKTPITPSTGKSLKDRLKQTLQKNAKIATPQSRSNKLQGLRAEEAKKDAEFIKQQISEHDIGPFYGLPSKVQQLLQANRGISKLYDWQNECLTLPAVKQSKNLIYSLPTSGGKTLVAEILIMREIMCKKRDAILVLPFVSIVQEKVRGMSTFALELDFLVEEYAGSKGSFPPKKRRKKQSLYIATIEKANSLVNSFVDEGRIGDIGLVVVDELHMLGEGGSRGAILEMTLAKLRHLAIETQIVGMSATLNNIQDLQDFLQAELYTNNFRPVELTEYVKMDDTIYQIHQTICPDDRLKHNRVVLFKYDKEMTRKDPDHLVGLTLEVIPQHSCLVFCPTKKNCENVADLLCRMMPRDITEHKKTEKKALLKALIHDGNGQICPVLKRTIPYGVAYHHSGLTMDERKLMEEAYSEGTLCLLCCTSTLAAGVNLPAKRVILRSPYVGENFLSRSQYKQMVGRAGRAGIDSSGESILILQKKDKLKLLDLVSGPCDSCQSSLLYMDGKGIRSLLLTTIGLKITNSNESVTQFLQKTLCYVQTKGTDIDLTSIADKGLNSLLELGLIVENKDKTDNGYNSGTTLDVTKLGRAVYKGSVDIDRGPQLLKDLCDAQESLCVANHLHLLYLVTPYDMVDQINPAWMIYLDELSWFDTAEQRVASLVGVTESYVSKKATSQRIRKAVNEFPIKRFYLTLILYNLWKQYNIWDVAAKFKLHRGFIQQLLSGAAAFASCVAHFCQELEQFWAYQDLFTNFVKKLSYCVTMELIPLMEIPGVKIGRARQLYNSDYRSIQQVAYADPEALVKSIEHLPRKTAKQIVASAQMMLQEKADSLRDEAEEMTTVPSNMPHVKTLEDTALKDGGGQGGDSQSSTSTTWGIMPTSQDI